MALALPAMGQTLLVTGIQDGQMTAQLYDAGDKTVQDVTTLSYYMPTGMSTSCNTYHIDGKNIVADLDTKTGDYFYRMVVTMSDGTVLKTDCFNADFSLSAIWLSDLTPTNGAGVATDICLDGQPILIDGVTFGKGISAQSPATVEYTLPRTYQYVQFTMGLQDCHADGTASAGFARMVTSVNGAETNWKGNLYAKSNPSRRNAVCKWDARWPLGTATMAINTFRLTLIDAGNTGNTDDLCNLGAVRFYTSELPKINQSVVFDTEGGFIPDDVPAVELKATPLRDAPVTYTIIQGRDIATIEGGNMLVPAEGCSGIVTVEASTAATPTLDAATAQISFRFNRAATVQYLAAYPTPGDEYSQTVYLYVDPKDKSVEELTLDIYSNVRHFVHQGAVDVAPVLASAATGIPYVYAVTAPMGYVHRLSYRFSGDDAATIEPYAEGHDSYVYMTDLPGNTVVTGWGAATVDSPFSGAVGPRLESRQYSYSKGYGLHAANNQSGAYVLTTAPLNEFDRFAADVAGQVITNTARGKISFSVHEGNVMRASSGNLAWSEVTEWNIPITGQSSIKVTVGNGGDNNQNDVAVIGAPRFYYRDFAKQPQWVQWPASDVRVDYYKPVSLPLEATASSGLPVLYRIAEGAEYAHLDGSSLCFDKIVTGGNVVVEALQPGNKLFDAARAVQCTFHVTDRLIVAKNERVEIDGNHDFDEIVVYADAASAGQVIMKDGIASVKNLIVKYTFVPGQWTYISFPSNLNIDEVSDLNEKGYYLNGGGPDGTGAYSLRSYNTRTRAHTPTNSPWDEQTNANVLALNGYTMCLGTELGTEPVEITFTVTNVSIDLESGFGLLHLTLDMSYSEPGAVETVYVKPANVKGNTLRVDVRFRPDNESALPVNHARALDVMRVTFTPDRKGLRLTLPDQQPARTAIFSADGKTLIKAFSYISPMVMNIGEIPAGRYRLVVVYGPASTVRDIEI